MRIDDKNALSQFTLIIDCEGNSVPFSWIDTIKRTGLEIYLERQENGTFQEVMRADGQVASLLWTEDKPFPYDIVIREPFTKERYTNPCEHELIMLENNAKRWKYEQEMEIKREMEFVTSSSRLEQEWQELNR